MIDLKHYYSLKDSIEAKILERKTINKPSFNDVDWEAMDKVDSELDKLLDLAKFNGYFELEAQALRNL
jgi:hypothetical protein